MIRRLSPTAVSFGIVLSAYGLYTVLAVPLIEPNTELAGVTVSVSPVAGANSIQPYYTLFARHFPPGHWALGSPKVLESPQVMLLLKDWRSEAAGVIQLVSCAVIFFPGRTHQDDSSTAAPIILEAPQGALLRFDDGFDLSRAKVGRLVHGQLVGPITIRSDMQQPGPADDLCINTTDVQLNTSRIWTEAAVTFRLGGHHGQGRQLEIRLLPTEPGQRRDADRFDVGGVHWLELKQDVRAHLDLGHTELMPSVAGPQPGLRAAGANAAARFPTADASQPPLKIACAGRFHFDLVRRTATFEDQVDVHRLRINAESDTLSCQLLTLEFDQVDRQPTRSKAAPEPVAGDRMVPPVMLRKMSAEGKPVKVDSPATGSTLRCQRLEYQPADRPTGLPQVTATGPGHCRTVVGNEPARQFQASWDANLALRYYEGEPILSLWGQATLAMPEAGELAADAMHLYLKEHTDPGSAERPQVLADRMVAVSEAAGARNVRLRSQPLTGAVEQLRIWFVRPATRATAGPDHAARATEATVADRDRQQGQPIRPPQATHDIGGRLLGMEVALDGGAPVVANLTVEGDVCLREVSTPPDDEQPLAVRGSALRVDGADTLDTQVTVQGAPASVTARGLALRGQTIRLSRGTNRLWVHSPGQMVLPVRRDLLGRPVAQAQRLHVSWRDALEFDGRTVQFRGDVVAQTDSGSLRSPSLVLTLSQEIRFDPSTDMTSVDAEAVVCQGGVLLEYQSFDNQRLMARNRMQAQDLAINRVSGAMHATGPGWVGSVHQAQGNPLAVRPAAATVLEPGTVEAGQLRYLRIDYDRTADGNLYQRTLTFLGQIRTVYGPVERWDDQIDADNARGVGPDCVLLTSDALTVTQTGLGGRVQDTLELDARGNAFMELVMNDGAPQVGQVTAAEERAAGGTFFARAERMSFVQSKDLIVLEGTKQADARLWRETRVGGPRSEVAARKILFRRADGRVRVDDAKFFSLSQLGTAPLPQEPGGAATDAAAPR
ncbi:MAG: hypothetical protein A2W31_06240 [Planctomycetes bacterium RBG_16_64_10]|nr:MAG: hypothetical protein A2W31_06240 [Planctomycetes bacterium RBG_16_64_10]